MADLLPVAVYAVGFVPFVVMARLLARLQRAEDRFAANPGLSDREIGVARRGRRHLGWFGLLFAGHAAVSLLDPPGAGMIRWILTATIITSAAVILARVARQYLDALFAGGRHRRGG